VYARELGQHDSFAAARPKPIRGWRAFARGAVAELAERGIELPGAHLEISADLPRAVGLSSSAALAIAIAMALASLAGAQPLAPVELARLCQRIENDWVGAQTGLLDQLASITGEQGRATLIDFQALTIEPVPLDLQGHTLVVLASGDRHSNAASGYNERRRETAEAAHRMGAMTLREAQIQDLHMLPDTLARRAKHVISENGRVLQTVGALRRGDLDAVGRLLDASHTSLRDDFEVSTPAVNLAVQRLKDSGALGARLIGGGFGGSVLGLMPPDAVPPPQSMVVTPAPGAHLLRQSSLP
jgi:galactokinase